MTRIIDLMPYEKNQTRSTPASSRYPGLYHPLFGRASGLQLLTKITDILLSIGLGILFLAVFLILVTI